MRPTVFPGDRGPEVSTLDQALLERGLFVPAEEAGARWYGPGTQLTVHDFQVKHCLAVDNIVGPKTWDALDAGPGDFVPSAPQLDLSNLPPFIATLLEVADTEYRRGVVEVPFGSNRGPDVDKYLLGHEQDGAYLVAYDGPHDGVFYGAPWCGRFAKWCVDEAALQSRAESPIAGWGDLASANKWKARAQRSNCYSGTPAVGSVGCILTGAHGHVVLVSDVDPEGAVATIEGNSGNRVAARNRRVEEFDGFVRL